MITKSAPHIAVLSSAEDEAKVKARGWGKAQLAPGGSEVAWSLSPNYG
jgi:hypothetical protein